jgi:pyridoxal phosphate enzyme (YggS family)
MSDVAQRIAENLHQVRERIAQAATRAGRDAGGIRLIGVTKYAGPELAAALIEAGLADLGESRPQELWRKAEALAGRAVRWHLIGHLQRNKVRRTLPLVTLVHSGDSLRLLEALNEESAALGRPCDVLLEVNLSGEPAKHGFAPGELAPQLPAIAALSHLRVRGLMGMAGLDTSRDEARRQFAALRQLREKLLANCPPAISLAELSMGMSGDFEEAIAEGATMVRVGSALFEGLTS